MIQNSYDGKSTYRNAYKAIEPWSSFKNIEKIIMPEYKLTYLIGSEVPKIRS